MKHPFRLAIIGLGIFAVCTPGLRAEVSPDGDEIKLVLILTRHGIRSPIHHTNEDGLNLSAQPWPTWEVPPSYLTPHGKDQMKIMGAYYRAVYTAAGVLQGNSAQDLPHIYFRADSDQRTIETAKDLAAGLLPGSQPEVHAKPEGQPDPLFTPFKLHLGHPDTARGVAEVLGRLGGDPRTVIQACAPAFALEQEVLFGPNNPKPAGRTALLDLPLSVAPGESDHLVDIHGPLEEGMRVADSLVLEYGDGMPLDQVGWGRVTPGVLTELLRLHSLYFDLTQRTFYPAQVQNSNMASHMLKTLQQAASGQADPGAIAPPDAKVVILIGHDTNIANFGGLIGANWWLPGTQENPVLPGGALVLELRQRRGEASMRVRTFYVSQDFDQMRTGQPLSPQSPPGIAPIFIHGCSEAGPGFDAPLPAFEALLKRVIDPEFVLPSSS